MLNKCSGALAAALATPQFAFAANRRLRRASVPKKAIEAHNGKWIQLTQEQWEFLRGIYAMNPLTPSGCHTAISGAGQG
jgi:hypothetical protein